MKKLLLAAIFLYQGVCSFGQTSITEIAPITNKVSYIDSIKTIQNIISGLQPLGKEGLPKNTYSIQIDFCRGTFELNSQNNSSNEFISSSEMLTGKLNDISECIINGDDQSCNLTIKSKYNNQCFSRSSTKKVFGFPDEGDIPTHFIYLGEFKSNELQKLLKIRNLLDFLSTYGPPKPLTPSFFKQDTNLIQLQRKFTYTWNEQNQKL